jgi:hypothetical protein
VRSPLCRPVRAGRAGDPIVERPADAAEEDANAAGVLRPDANAHAPTHGHANATADEHRYPLDYASRNGNIDRTAAGAKSDRAGGDCNPGATADADNRTVGDEYTALLERAHA